MKTYQLSIFISSLIIGFVQHVCGDEPVPAGLGQALRNPKVPAIVDATILKFNKAGHGKIKLNTLYKLGLSIRNSERSEKSVVAAVPEWIRGYGYAGSDKIAPLRIAVGGRLGRFLFLLDGNLLYSTYNNWFPIREGKNGVLEVGTGFNGGGAPWKPLVDMVQLIPGMVSPTFEEWVKGGNKIPEGRIFTGGSPWFDESRGRNRSPEEVYEILYSRKAKKIPVQLSGPDGQATDLTKPLKVYLLVGQSNMQGHAHVRTFDHIGMDPKTAPILKAIRNADGTPKVCENVWISSVDTAAPEGERHGRLTAGYGASGRAPKIGPELTFGIYMQQHVDEPILLIKTAWGGKSLNTDFRPPSAGPYEFNAQQLENLKKQGKDLAQAKADCIKRTSQYYRLMMEHIKKVLGDIKRVYPAYDTKAGYELAGFVWFQGWNDMVDRGTYPNRGEPGGYVQYSEVLVHFIRDVRKDLAVPKLPFIIGVMGAGGPVEKYGPDQKRYVGIHSEFRKAMSAPARLLEFKGNVTAVFTEKYWDLQLTELSSRMDKVNAKHQSLGNDKTLRAEEQKKLVEDYKAKLFTKEELRILETGISNAAYHYLGSAKILGQIGKAFADALAKMQ